MKAVSRYKIDENNAFPNGKLAEKCWLLRNIDGRAISTRRARQKGGTDMLAHLRSVLVRKGRSPCDKDTGNFRQSWHRSGHRRGQKSIRQYLYKHKDTLLETFQTVQRITEKKMMGSVPVSSSGLYFLFVRNCNGSKNMSQQQQQKKERKEKCIFKEKRLLFAAWYSGWPPAVMQFSIWMHRDEIFKSCFAITSGHSRRQQKACSLPDHGSRWAGCSHLHLGSTWEHAKRRRRCYKAQNLASQSIVWTFYEYRALKTSLSNKCSL